MQVKQSVLVITGLLILTLIKCVSAWNAEEELRNLTQQLKTVQQDIQTLQEEALQNKQRGESIHSPPAGYIYMQYPTQPPPTRIWPNAAWEDVTYRYAGSFFRALGGGAASWGEEQEENVSKITDINSKLIAAEVPSGASIPLSGTRIRSANDVNGGGGSSSVLQITFVSSGGEVRPRNYGIKLWKKS